MPEITITIKNLPEIKMAFKKSPILMVRELNKAIRRSIVSVERDSKSNTPVDTGRLRSSTYDRFTNLTGEVGTNTSYDIYVHDGTRFMKARPYLWDAVGKNEKVIDDNFEKAVENVLDEIGSQT